MRKIVKIFHQVSEKTNIKLHYIETLIVAIILSAVALISKKGAVEWFGVVGVILTFEYQVLSTYLTEHSEARKRIKSDVKSDTVHKEIRIIYLLKECIWVVYFIFLGAYSALVGSIIFILYAYWRKTYRKHIPLQEQDIL